MADASQSLWKAKDAPPPKSGSDVTRIATRQPGLTQSQLKIPPLYRPIYRDAAAADRAPPRPPALRGANGRPTVSAEPTATSTATLTATVFNGGNIRKEPQVGNNVAGQLHAGEATLLERSATASYA